MLQDLFPFDIFGFINGIFVIVFVIVIIFFIIVILIVYKLIHLNVDNVKKKSKQEPKITVESSDRITKGLEKEDSISNINLS